MAQKIKIQDGILVYGATPDSVGAPKPFTATFEGQVNVGNDPLANGIIGTSPGTDLTIAPGADLKLQPVSGNILLNTVLWPPGASTTGQFIGSTSANNLGFLPLVLGPAVPFNDVNTGSQLNAQYPTALPGQSVYGPTLLYQCVGAGTWMNMAPALGYIPVNKAGDTMLGDLILNQNPTLALGAATKQYVDTFAAGLIVHEAVETASTAPLPSCVYYNGIANDGVGATLTASVNGDLGAVGGYSLFDTTKRCLVKDQAFQLQNGIYTVDDKGSPTTKWVMTRATDFDNSMPAGEINTGDFTFVQEGTLSGTQWAMITVGTITVGVTSIVFSQLSGAPTVPTLPATRVAYGSGVNLLTSTADFIYNDITGTLGVGPVGFDAMIGANTGRAIVINGDTGATLQSNFNTFKLSSSGELLVNMSAGTTGQVLTSAGPAVPAGWQTPVETALTFTQIAYGSAGNTVTSSAEFTYDELTGALTVNNTLSLVAPGNVMIKAPATNTGINTNGGTITIQGGLSDAAFGGDVNIYAGDGLYGGKVSIYGGYASGADGGDVVIHGGSGLTGIDVGGKVEIKGGDSIGGVANNVTIYGGLGITNGTVQMGTAGVLSLYITANQNVRIGVPSLTTTATDGFPYIPTCAGTPTGVPTAITGSAPLVTDSSNNKLYFYSGGAWRTSGTGTVTAVSVVSSNGFAGSSGGGTTPALTLTTTVTGMVKGNGTALSAATSGTDYSAGTNALATGILKSTTTTGALSIAVAGDFPTLNQNTSGSAAKIAGGAIGDVLYQSAAGVTAFASPGVAGQILTSNGVTTAPTWQAAAAPATTPVCIQVACSDETTALTTGVAKVTFRAPYAFTVTAVRASVTTAATGATLLTVDINESGVSILSTKLTFDASELTTVTAATPPVISDTAIADDAQMTIDIDAVGNTIAGAGLKVTIIGTKP